MGLGDGCDGGEEFSFPESQLAAVADVSKSDAERLKTAKRLADMCIHLHDGKDYIDDALPQFTKLLLDESVSLELRVWVGAATVRLLAHGWDWNAKNFKEAIAVASLVLRRYRVNPSQVSDEALHGAVLTLQQIFDPANDSETEQEDKKPGDDMKTIERYFAPPEVGTDPSIEQESAADVLMHVLEELMKSKVKGLASTAAKLLAKVTPSKKRGRRENVVEVFLSNIASLCSAPNKDASSKVVGMLKGLNKILVEASFDARNDVCEEDADQLRIVTPHLTALIDVVQQILLRFPATVKKGSPNEAMTYDNVQCAGEERCLNKHWDASTEALILLRCIQASFHRREPSVAAHVVHESDLSILAKAWQAHRFHIKEFEEVEACLAHIVKDKQEQWDSLFDGSSTGGKWICWVPRSDADSAPSAFGLGCN